MNPFNHKRIYSNQQAIFNEANFDDRKNKVGSDRVISIPKVNLKVDKLPLNAGVFNMIRQLTP